MRLFNKAKGAALLKNSIFRRLKFLKFVPNFNQGLLMKNALSTFRLGKFSVVATTTVCLLCCIPQQGFCASVPIDMLAINLANFDYKKPDLLADTKLALYYSKPTLTGYLDDLTDSICDSNDPLASTRQFIQVYIDKLNKNNGTAIGMSDVCVELRRNIDLVPVECREYLYKSIDLLESSNSNCPSSLNNILAVSHSFYWPWEWNWFGLNKPEKKHEQNEMKALSSGYGKYVVFGLIVAGLTIVAIYNPVALNQAVDAMMKASSVCL